MPRQLTAERLDEYRAWLLECRSISTAMARARDAWGWSSINRSTVERGYRTRFGRPQSADLIGAAIQLPPLQPPAPAPTVQPAEQPIPQSLADQLAEIRASTPRAVERVAQGPGRTLILLISDTHVGIGNSSLEQLEQLPARVAAEAERYHVEEIAVCVLGDICDGEDKYWGQTVRLKSHALEQGRIAGRALFSAIRPLHHDVAPCRVYCVPGNHGDTKHSQYDNWDFVAYEILALLLDADGIPCRYEWAPQLAVEVRGHRGMIQHGKWGHVRAPEHAGTPAARCKVLQWADVFSADWLAWGHYHHHGCSTVNGVRLFVNGALGGDTDYSPQIGCRAAPAQLAIIASEQPSTSWPVIPIEWAA